LSTQLKVGDKAPNFQFDTPWKSAQDFYETIQHQDAVFVFLRYHGCPVCQMEMARIKGQIDLFRQKNLAVFVVLQSKPETIASLSDPRDWPFTIICDPDGGLFKQYGVAASLIKYLHPAGLLAAIKATLSGFSHGKFEGRETQLPAAFVVGANHLIQHAHYGKTINDVPCLEALSDSA
jgi:peroxiredoxin